MNDDNWETIGGDIAREIEVLNYANQTNVLHGLIIFLLAHRGPSGASMPPMPDVSALCDLHRAGTLFLLSDAGSFRNMEVEIRNGEGQLIYTPPKWQRVDLFMQHFFRNLSSVWTSGDALDVAAYALWRINWVHPFKNGNGRTARAFSYACLSLKMGVFLPGEKTVVDFIMQDRPRYQDVLRAADANPLRPDLAPMKAFLDDCLQAQISSSPITAQSD